MVAFEKPQIAYLMKAVYCFDTPPPFLFAKTLILVSGKKNVLLLPDSPMPPESLAGGRIPSSYGHSDGKSQYRSASLCLSF